MTKGPVLLDTGPLVSFLGSGLRHHSWTAAQWKRLRPPLLTREGRGADAVFELLERKAIRIALSVQEEQGGLRALMHRYRNRQMSLADACLVRLSEIHNSEEIFTLDSRFRIYRRHGNKIIPVRMPI